MTFRLALLISAAAAVALAGSEKIARDLDNVSPGANVAVIVQYAHAPGQADLDQLAGRGGWSVRALRSLNGVALHLPAARLAALAALPGVQYITADRMVRRS